MSLWASLKTGGKPENQAAETRSIEDLLDFIDGKADEALKDFKAPGRRVGRRSPAVVKSGHVAVAQKSVPKWLLSHTHVKGSVVSGALLGEGLGVPLNRDSLGAWAHIQTKGLLALGSLVLLSFGSSLWVSGKSL